MNNLVFCNLFYSGSSAIVPIIETVVQEEGICVTPYGPGSSGLLVEVSPPTPFFHWSHSEPELFQPFFERQNLRVAYLHRDPRDVLISYLHDHINRGVIDPANMRKLLLGLPYSNFGTAIRSAARWVQLAKTQPIIILRFDDMKRDVVGTALKVLEFYGFEPNERRAARVRELYETRYSFEAMAGRIRGSDGETVRNRFMVRKGISGEWRQHFDDEISDSFRQALGVPMALLGYEPVEPIAQVPVHEDPMMDCVIPAAEGYHTLWNNFGDSSEARGILESAIREHSLDHGGSALQLADDDRLALLQFIESGLIFFELRQEAEERLKPHIRSAVDRCAHGERHFLTDEIAFDPRIDTFLTDSWHYDATRAAGVLIKDMARRATAESYLCRFFLSSVVRLVGLEQIYAYGARIYYVFGEMQVWRIRRFVGNRRQRLAAFFCPQRSYRGTYGDLPDILEAKGIPSIRCYCECYQDEFENQPNSFFVDKPILDRVLPAVFFTGSPMGVIPAKSIKVLVGHTGFAPFNPPPAVPEPPPPTGVAAADETPPTPMPTPQSAPVAENAAPPPVEPEFSFDELLRTASSQVYATVYDYFIGSSGPAFDDLLKAFRYRGLAEDDIANPRAEPPQFQFIKRELPKHGFRVPQRLALIPAGYPQIDRNARAAALSKPEKVITYAPTPLIQSGKSDWRRFGAGMDGVEVVAALCEAFPDYEVVYKPHTVDDPGVVEAINARGRAFSNYRFDTSGSLYASLYSRTMVMVSDFSGTAYSYAMAYQRPVVFYSRNEAEVQARCQHDEYVRYRTDLGMVATTPAEVASCLRDVALNIERYAENIRNLKERYFFNAGNSERYIAQYIEHILSGETCPEWKYFYN